MNAFESARTVEARSLLALRPFLEETQGSYVLTGKGRLARFLQETAGDLLFNDREGRIWSVELKAEQKWTGNVFLETWSNRNLDDRANHAAVGCKVGWLATIGADLLFYHFLDTDVLLIFDLFALKKWAFESPSRHPSEPNPRGEKVQKPGRIWDFEERRQTKYDQRNDTRGRIVPVATLMREMKPPPRKLSVRQLALDLFGQEAA